MTKIIKYPDENYNLIKDKIHRYLNRDYAKEPSSEAKSLVVDNMTINIYDIVYTKVKDLIWDRIDDD